MSNMGRNRTLRLRFSPPIHPNPGKMASSLPAVPMWSANNGMFFPQKQDNSGMLKKSNTAPDGLALS
jgi:hypothetical protein